MCLAEPAADALVVGLSHRAVCGGEVIGMAVGPPGWEPALRDAIAFGADRVTRLWDDGDEGGIVETAAAIAAALPAAAGAVIAGPAAPDHGSGMLPFALAECLGWPAVEDVVAVESENGKTVLRVRGRGGRRFTLALPAHAVLVAARGHALPYPPVARRLAARRAAIPLLARAGHGGAPWIIEGYGPAMPVTRHLLRPAANTSAGGRLRHLMSGGATSAQGRASAPQGSDNMVAQLADILAGEGLFE